MKQPLAYFGHHKCASNWCVNVVRSCCEALGTTSATFNNWLLFEEDCKRQSYGYHKDFLLNAERAGCGFLCITDCDDSIRQATPFERGFHVVRDPRDIIVSAYFSHMNTHNIDYLPGMEKNRRELQSMSKRDGLLHTMDFLAGLMEDLASWQSDDRILEVRMEDVLTSPFLGMTRILSHLGIMESKMSEEFNGAPKRISPLTLQKIVNENSFEVLSGGRSRGQENTSSHYRKGMPGDWINHFEDIHIEVFKKYYNGLLIKWGYTEEEDWGVGHPPLLCPRFE
jgi:hypothetical protein